MKLIVFSHFSDKHKIHSRLRPPSLEMIERTILTGVQFSGVNPEGGILFHDDDFAMVSRERIEYSRRVQRLAESLGMDFHQPDKRLGYRGAFLAVADLLALRSDVGPKENYFWLEHDWWMTRPVELERIEDMLERDDCHYIKLANYHDETERFGATPIPCPHYEFDQDRRGEDVVPGKWIDPRTVGFMRDTLWSTNPNFGKMKRFFEYAEMLRRNPYKDTHINGNAAGIEEIILPAYFEKIRADGFAAAHKEWGTWLMLNCGGFRRLVEHMGV